MITMQEAMTAQRFEHTSQLNKDNTPIRCRRNGKTQTWKRKPTEFKIPVKYGLYDYFYITQDNCGEWNVQN